MINFINPLQYSCLGNSMDRGTWRGTIHGVTRARHDGVTKSPPPPVQYSNIGYNLSKQFLIVGHLGYFKIFVNTKRRVLHKEDQEILRKIQKSPERAPSLMLTQSRLKI